MLLSEKEALRASDYLCLSAVGDGTIPVDRVPVVHIAVSVHVPHIVSVASIGRTGKDVLSIAYIP